MISAKQIAGGSTELCIDARGLVSIERAAWAKELCRAGEMSILVRSHRDPSEPASLSLVSTAERRGAGVRFLFADAQRRFKADLVMKPSEEGITCDCTVRAPWPIWLFEWSISGIQSDEILVPGLGGQSLAASTGTDYALSFKYPFWWNAQFVVAPAGNTGLVLEARETEPRLKLLRIRRSAAGFTITYGVEANAPIKERTLSASWNLETYEGSWTVPADRHRAWMSEAFKLRPLEQNPFVPDWFKEISMVLELWGMRKDQPQPHHTFAEMQKRINEWSQLFEPARTLLYLPGYEEHGIDSHAPDYEPGEALGGAKAFRSLIEKAHALGYKVMIHTNALAMTYTHRKFPAFKRHQVVDVFGRPQSWGLDMDGDWLAEPYFAYINPGVRAWTELLIATIRSLVKRFKVDAVFLDQTLLAFNTSRGPNFLTGMRSHLHRLHQAFPGLLLGGEGLHEHVLAELPMAQIHGIDSIAEVHGLEGLATWRSAHPISTYLFSPFTRFTAHLLTRHPSHPAFAMQEEAYARLGVLPALCLYDADQPLDTEGTREMIERARTILPIPTTAKV